MKHTPWFAWPIRPVRAGWYEVQSPNFDHFRLWWNGYDWQYLKPGRGPFIATWLMDGDEWRGLVKPAKERE
jgi:hypothetical protein